MLKVRITYEHDNPSELETILNHLSQSYRILNKSKPYKGRGQSAYSNIYLDITKEQKDETDCT